MSLTTTELIKIHVWAGGPVSFKSIVAYCREQMANPPEEYQVAATLNAMIRNEVVELYDDGVSFTAGNACRREQRKHSGQLSYLQ